MSDQFDNESMTPEVVRQALLAEIDATRQAIAELSNEQLEEVVGGGKGWDIVRRCFACGAGKPDTSDTFYRSVRSIGRETRTYNGGLRTFEDDYRAGGSPVVAEGRRTSFDASIHKINTMTQASPEHK